LRAYVNISRSRIVEPLNPEKRYFALEVKNFGQTPAHDQILWVSTVVREFPRKSAPATSPPPGFQMGKESLPPGRTSLISVPVGPLNAWEETQLRTGKAAIYITGEINYRDVFDAPHTTTFRLFCYGEGLPGGRVAADTEGNAAT
jgi:hypothetical protein